MSEPSQLTTCPNCSRTLHPPLKSSGRQLCGKCGWTNKPSSTNQKGTTHPTKASVKSYVSSASKSQGGHPSNPAKLSKPILYGLVAAGALAVTGWGATILFAKYQAHQCQTATETAVGQIAEEWDDVMSRAKNSSRINIHASIDDLQTIKRTVGNAE